MDLVAKLLINYNEAFIKSLFSMVFIQSLYHNERLLCDLACHLHSLGTIRRIRCYLMHMIFIMDVNNI
jgi:hypothetical protein